MPTSEELLELAEQAAKKVELDGKLHYIPSFSDAEEQCENEYEDLLQAIHDDDVFEPVDLERQETLVEQIAAALPEDKRTKARITSGLRSGSASAAGPPEGGHYPRATLAR